MCCKYNIIVKNGAEKILMFLVEKKHLGKILAILLNLNLKPLVFLYCGMVVILGKYGLEINKNTILHS